MTKQTLWKSLKLKEGTIVSDHDHSSWTVGEWRNNPYPVKVACEGLNCCRHAADAMGYVNCEVLAQVEIRGKQIEEGDKITVQEMRILSAWKWMPKDSAELAIYAAELVLDVYEKKYPSDPRVREAITKAKECVAAIGTDAAYAATDAAYAAARAAYAAARAAYAATDAAYAAADAAYAATDAAYAAARAAYAAARAAYAAARAAYAAAYAADEREKLKIKIDRWIINHLETCEKLEV